MLPAQINLAQQGQFSQFAMLYCCAIPAGVAAVLAMVYVAVRWYAARSERD